MSPKGDMNSVYDAVRAQREPLNAGDDFEPLSGTLTLGVFPLSPFEPLEHGFMNAAASKGSKQHGESKSPSIAECSEPGFPIAAAPAVRDLPSRHSDLERVNLSYDPAC